DWHVFEIEACNGFKISRKVPYCLNETGKAYGMGRGLVGSGGEVRQGVTQRLGLPHESAPDMGDTDVLCNAGNVALQHRVVFQARQSLPNGDPNILYKIIDPVGMAFIHRRELGNSRNMMVGSGCLRPSPRLLTPCNGLRRL